MYQYTKSYFILLIFIIGWGVQHVLSQPITGVWRGKMIQGTGFKQRTAPLEVKLIAQGDSIVGTAYYYGSGKNFIRYSLKGYFGQEYNTVYWQDYSMIDIYPKKGTDTRAFEESLKAAVDFSCPDGKTMKLDGTAKLPGVPEFRLELKKMDATLFPDEWDDVIAGYFMGMARKDIVDSVWKISSEPLIAKTSTVSKVETGAPAKNVKPENEISGARPVEGVPIKPVPKPVDENKEQTIASQQTATPATPPPSTAQKAPPKPAPKPSAPVDITAEIAKSNAENRQKTTVPPASNPVPLAESPVPKAETSITNRAPVAPPPSVGAVPTKPISAPVMEQAFRERRKIIQIEIPIRGDTLELRFYDNADVDGDSISLFLNNVALFQNIRLDVRPYIFKIPIQDLPEFSELAMVAENLGAIPPNTAFMEAFVDGRRYTARIESTEQTTGVIRLMRRQ